MLHFLHRSFLWGKNSIVSIWRPVSKLCYKVFEYCTSSVFIMGSKTEDSPYSVMKDGHEAKSRHLVWERARLKYFSTSLTSQSFC